MNSLKRQDKRINRSKAFLNAKHKTTSKQLSNQVTLIMNKRQRVMSALIDLRQAPQQVDERNRGHLIRCAALGMKSTQEEIDVDFING